MEGGHVSQAGQEWQPFPFEDASLGDQNHTHWEVSEKLPSRETITRQKVLKERKRDNVQFPLPIESAFSLILLYVLH